MGLTFENLWDEEKFEIKICTKNIKISRIEIISLNSKFFNMFDAFLFFDFKNIYIQN